LIESKFVFPPVKTQKPCTTRAVDSAGFLGFYFFNARLLTTIDGIEFLLLEAFSASLLL